MLYFGIDWSEDQHNLCIRNAAGAAISRVAFEHSLAGFERLEVERRKLNVPASDCPVAIETTYNLVVDFLLEHDYPVYIVPPQATEGYRNRQRSSGAHDDDSDAALLADILRTDRESHRRLRPNTALTQQILAQVRLIEILRRSIQRQSNQLRAVLRRTYAPAVGLFSDLTAPITLQFLSQYPTACEAQALSRQAFETFLRAHGYTRSDLIPLRYARLQEPAPAAQPAVVQAYRSQVQTLAHILLPQVRARAQVLAQLEQLFHQHPDAPLFDSLPGAGPLLAPALLASSATTATAFRWPPTCKPWRAPARSPSGAGNANGSSSGAAAIRSSAASPSSSHWPPWRNPAGPAPTGRRSGPTATRTHTLRVSWPIVGWRSSGNCGRPGNRMTKPITCSNARVAVRSSRHGSDILRFSC